MSCPVRMHFFLTCFVKVRRTITFLATIGFLKQSKLQEKEKPFKLPKWAIFILLINHAYLVKNKCHKQIRTRIPEGWAVKSQSDH